MLHMRRSIFISLDLRHQLTGGPHGGGLVALARLSSFRLRGRRPRQVFPPIRGKRSASSSRLFGHWGPNKGIASGGTEATRATSPILRFSPSFTHSTVHPADSVFFLLHRAQQLHKSLQTTKDIRLESSLWYNCANSLIYQD